MAKFLRLILAACLLLAGPGVFASTRSPNSSDNQLQIVAPIASETQTSVFDLNLPGTPERPLFEVGLAVVPHGDAPSFDFRPVVILSAEPVLPGDFLSGGASLYYFNARFYDPTVGRFLNEDPARDGMNWYEYARNNPLRFVDPTGLMTAEESARYEAGTSGQTIQRTLSGVTTTPNHVVKYSNSPMDGTYIDQARHPISELAAENRVAIEKAISDPKNQPEGNTTTYCNLAVQEFMQHIGDLFTSKFAGLKANSMIKAMSKSPDFSETTNPEGIQALANLGVPIFAGRTSSDPKKSGHIGVVVPRYVQDGYLLVGQAGNANGYFTANGSFHDDETPGSTRFFVELGADNVGK